LLWVCYVIDDVFVRQYTREPTAWSTPSALD
jgi:hypothetical protein